jgi:Na+/H+ antiporter NhaD/arsenite permease-like protein
MKKKPFLSLLFCINILFVLNTHTMQAKYKDKSDELPGMVDDSQLIKIAAIGGVVITGIIIYGVLHKSQKNKVSTINYGTDGINYLTIHENDKDNSFYNEIIKASNQSKLQIVTGYDYPHNFGSQNKTCLKIGLRLNF